MITKAFDAALQVGDGAGLLDLIQIGFSEFMIGDALGEHVIGGDPAPLPAGALMVAGQTPAQASSDRRSGTRSSRRRSRR